MKKRNLGYKKWTFFASICLVLFILLLTGQQGKTQDKAYLNDYMLYQEALQDYEQGDFDLAFSNYQMLLNDRNYHNSIKIKWEMAKTEIQRQNYSEAIEYYEMIIDQFPSILVNKSFLEQYGWVLDKTGDERAAKYLDRIK